jgi:hypothetical protein
VLRALGGPDAQPEDHFWPSGEWVQWSNAPVFLFIEAKHSTLGDRVALRRDEIIGEFMVRQHAEGALGVFSIGNPSNPSALEWFVYHPRRTAAFLEPKGVLHRTYIKTSDFPVGAQCQDAQGTFFHYCENMAAVLDVLYEILCDTSAAPVYYGTAGDAAVREAISTAHPLLVQRFENLPAVSVEQWDPAAHPLRLRPPTEYMTTDATSYNTQLRGIIWELQWCHRSGVYDASIALSDVDAHSIEVIMVEGDAALLLMVRAGAETLWYATVMHVRIEFAPGKHRPMEERCCDGLLSVIYMLDGSVLPFLMPNAHMRVHGILEQKAWSIHPLLHALCDARAALPPVRWTQPVSFRPGSRRQRHVLPGHAAHVSGRVGRHSPHRGAAPGGRGVEPAADGGAAEGAAA